MAVQDIGPVGAPSPITRDPHAANPAVATKPTEAPPSPPEEHKTPIASEATTGLRFVVDPDTGKTIVSVINPESGEVIRQVPSEEALATAKAIGKMQGAFIDLKV